MSHTRFKLTFCTHSYSTYWNGVKTAAVQLRTNLGANEAVRK
jgi:hypothetical protein